tara:strand:+ start:164 stop:748 length:585 start_codon:yes stop_codon:yes gene_type:complete
MSDWIFIATDSLAKVMGFDATTGKFDRANCYKMDSISAEELKKYNPLNLFFQVKEKDNFGNLTKGLEKIEDGYRVTGVIMGRGRPLPTANEFKVGDSFSYPYLYEGESENLAKPIVTEIITDVKELINWVRKTETLMDKKIQMAEQYYEAEQESFHSEQYEKTMADLSQDYSKPEWLRKYKSESFHSKNFINNL